MNIKIYFLLVGLCIFFAPAASLAQCGINANLESGNLTNWQGRGGINSNGTVNLNLLLSGGPGALTVMTPGPDPIVGIINRVGEGNYSLRLGDSQVGARLDLAWYSFTVTSANANFSFKYALVMQDPVDHTPIQKPFFGYGICKGTNPSTAPGNKILAPGASLHIIGDRNDPFFRSVNDIVYRTWTTACVDLSGYIGQMVTIYFYTADCVATGHFGYAYIDGLCENNDPVASFTMPSARCITGPIIADGTASINETSHLWTIEESDQWGGRPNPSSEIIDYQSWPEAGSIDLQDIMQRHGRKFKCNTYYRVKLAVGNCRNPWNEMVKLLYITCPPNINAGPDIMWCCTQAGVLPITIGPPATNGNTYSWYWFRNNSIFLSGITTSQLTITQAPPSSTGYVLTVTDSMGCVARDTVFFYLLDPIRLNITQTPGTACNTPIVLTAVPELTLDSCHLEETNWWIERKRKLPISYLWNTGDTGMSITVNPGSTTNYWVTSPNQCVSTQGNITVNPCPSYTGPFPTINFYNTISPNGDGINDYLDMVHPSFSGGPGAYNALEYRLQVFNRWGQLIAELIGKTDRCTGFINGAVPHWDGTYNVGIRKRPWQFWRPKPGTKVPTGVYFYIIELKNCTYTSWFKVVNASLQVWN